MDSLELPLGFGMALAQNEQAMHAFEAMTEAQKRAVIEQAHAVSSRREMQQLVSGLVSGK
ncbi:MAG: hypothetical protein SPE19_03475 [Candidatus Faecousia sp.]|nr:hypothetical protein [Candidatus Faecousia sp.]